MGGRRTVFQSDTVDEPVTRLSHRLVRADNVGVSHDESEVPGEGHARIRCDDGELWLRGHLCRQTKSVSRLQQREKGRKKRSEWGGDERRLTLLGEVLTWGDGAHAGEVDGHDGRGDKGRQEGRDEASIGKMGFDGCDAQGGVVGGLGINEGAQERKSDGGCEEKHDGGKGKGWLTGFELSSN